MITSHKEEASEEVAKRVDSERTEDHHLEETTTTETADHNITIDLDLIKSH